MDVPVLKSCVTETKLTPRLSNSDNKRVKSSNERLSRSTLYTTTQSIRRASMSANNRFKAGRARGSPR